MTTINWPKKDDVKVQYEGDIGTLELSGGFLWIAIALVLYVIVL